MCETFISHEDRIQLIVDQILDGVTDDELETEFEKADIEEAHLYCLAVYF